MKRLVCLTLIFLLLIVVSSSTLGQELERISGESTGWWWYSNASVEALATAFDVHGARLIDLEVTSVSPLRFSACLVENSGCYASAWWWYFGIDGDRVSELLDELSARIIDLEVYSVRGELRFAVILVPNTGSQSKAWWWYYNASAENLSDLVTQHNARLVDLETYDYSGQHRYAAVMIRNTEDDDASWWFTGLSTAELSDAMSSHSARILDLERMSNGRYAVILVRPRSASWAWWWWYGLRFSDITEVAGLTKGRIVDVEQYSYGGSTRFLVVMTGAVDTPAPALTEAPVQEMYPVRIEVSTTSDWTDIRFVDGTISVQSQEILEGAGTSGLQIYARSAISMSQDCCETLPIRISFDAVLSNPGEWLQLEIDKGHIGQTTVSLYSPGESEPIDTYNHTGVVENADPANVRTFWIHSPYLITVLPRVLASPSE